MLWTLHENSVVIAWMLLEFDNLRKECKYPSKFLLLCENGWANCSKLCTTGTDKNYTLNRIYALQFQPSEKEESK